MRSHIFIYCMTRSFKILCYSCCNVIFIIPNDFVPFCLWCKSSKEKKTNHKNFLEHLHLKMTRFPSSPRKCHANIQWISRQRMRHSVILGNDGICWPEHQAKHVHIHNCMPHDVYSLYIFLWNRDRFAVGMIKAFDCAFEHFEPIMCMCVFVSFIFFYSFHVPFFASCDPILCRDFVDLQL